MDFIGYTKNDRADVRVSIIEENRHLSFQREQVFGYDCEPVETEDMPSTYIAYCNDAMIIGGSSVVVSSDGTILYDMLHDWKKYNANVTDHGLFMLTGKPLKIGTSYFYNYRTKEKESITSGISLACNMSENYYHFIYDCAARLTLLQKYSVPKDVPLLVDEHSLAIPSINAFLQSMNVEGRRIIPLKNEVAYMVNCLYVLSPVNKVVPNTMNPAVRKGHAFDANVLSEMRARLLPLATKRATTPKRIFISRSKCLKRQLNEEELFPVLKGYGFERVFTEGMTLSEQVTLFFHAEHIVASSGAALSNLLFCKPGTKVLIFISPRRPGIYSSLALPLGLESQALIVDSSENRLHALHYYAKPDELKKYLTSIHG